ncbi:MAG: HD domain-containing protein [Candidatus Asgardarchaeia archaeon]
MNREEALAIVKEYIKDDKLFKHVLAVEAIMRRLAEHFGEDVEKWGLTGLLHDIDYEMTMNDPEKHAKVAYEILKGKVDEDILHAILSHNYEHTGVNPESRMDKCLIMADAASGFIIAVALVMPNKKLSEIKEKTLKKKFKDKTFARGTGRDRMKLCEEVGIPLMEFLKMAHEALLGISEELGL